MPPSAPVLLRRHSPPCSPASLRRSPKCWPAAPSTHSSSGPPVAGCPVPASQIELQFEACSYSAADAPICVSVLAPNSESAQLWLSPKATFCARQPGCGHGMWRVRAHQEGEEAVEELLWLDGVGTLTFQVAKGQRGLEIRLRERQFLHLAAASRECPHNGNQK